MNEWIPKYENMKTRNMVDIDRHILCLLLAVPFLVKL